jgi:hypothetical protein
MTKLVLALFVGVATAFVPPSVGPARSAPVVQADATSMEGISKPVG